LSSDFYLFTEITIGVSMVINSCACAVGNFGAETKETIETLSTRVAAIFKNFIFFSPFVGV
tara:strand:+ start:68 stop:250 length:183 start_codon:yes stop_codon:yes gene_type:complete